MVQIIAGRKGKGKTKYLLDMANTAVKEAKGSIVYLDKSSKHMYELNNRIRLINVAEFSVSTAEGSGQMTGIQMILFCKFSQCNILRIIFLNMTVNLIHKKMSS